MIDAPLPQQAELPWMPMAFLRLGRQALLAYPHLTCPP
jgi:hypothetical protein